MAEMVDKKPEFYGESIVWENFATKLPKNVVIYNQREVKGREFDFCLLVENKGLLIVEVKGWKPENIIKVLGIDEIIIDGYDKPQRSPKKQARSYRFSLLNTIQDKYNVSPLIMDMVCYPFITEKIYKEKRLDTVSEPEFTIFKEDLEDRVRLIKKIGQVFNGSKNTAHDDMNEKLVSQIRNYFEPNYSQENPIAVEYNTRYSALYIFNEKPQNKSIRKIIDEYITGIKTVLFVRDEETVEFIFETLQDRLEEENIGIEKNNLVLNSKQSSKFELKNNAFIIFGLEIYLVPSIEEIVSSDKVICEGNINEDERKLLLQLGDISTFNAHQYFIEHAPVEKNVLVSAGAGTGKTYSMVSRIAFLCNRMNNSVVNLIDDIAMVTFTNDAADNMKNRLKQMFINYYILTKNPRYIKCIEDINFMQISTIHKFAQNIIKENSLNMGLGNDLSITSGEYEKEKLYEAYLNKYIDEQRKINPNFTNGIKLPLYEFKRMLMNIAKQLYNKSIDIKDIEEKALGKAPEEMDFFNDIIMQVIIPAERDYENSIRAINKIDLKETMILLNEAVEGRKNGKFQIAYKYIFIDEFQDTDNVQIDAFIKIQQLIRANCKLFVVGDIKQSIYRFRGAKTTAFKILQDAIKDWTRETININYRSDKGLLEKYNSVFTRLGNDKQLPYTEANDALISNLQLLANSAEPLKCENFSGQDERYKVLLKKLFEEKEKIIDIEKTKKLSTAEKTVAILVRENWQIDQIVKKIKALDPKIEIITKVGGDLYQLDSTMDFYKLLLALSNPRDAVCLMNFIESNYVKLNLKFQGIQNMNREEQIETLTYILDKFFEERMSMKWLQLIQYLQSKPILVVLKDIYEALKPYKQFSEDEESQRFYRSNYELVIEKLIKGFSVDYLTLNVVCDSIKINIITKQREFSRSYSNDKSGVIFLCTTVHKSKGLEYGTVVLPFTDQDISKNKKNLVDANYENSKLAYSIKVGEDKSACNSNYDTKSETVHRINEEARILYVALTRAIRNCVWLKNTNSKANVSWSSFLEG